MILDNGCIWFAIHYLRDNKSHLKRIQVEAPISSVKCNCIVLQIVDIIIEKAAANITDDGDRDLVLESIYNPVAGETNLHSCGSLLDWTICSTESP